LPSQITLTVLFFASTAEAARVKSWDCTMDEGALISDLSVQLQRQFPMVKPLLRGCRFACNESFVPQQHRLADGDTVALIPPVSGG
jgi:molybdopterin synthase sulfur carrier subunit